jgi:hypothetical protein
MDSEFWTALSGLLVSISGLYYAALVYLRKAPANPVSWAAWGVIGTAMFFTSGTTFGINAITFGMTNPIVITLVGSWRQYKEAKRPSRREVIGGSLGATAIIAWMLAEYHHAPSEWTLALAILGDCIPLWLIIQGAWKDPQDDKPFAWALFGFGFGLSAFGLTELSVFTLALPVYMVLGSGAVTLPLVMYRIRHRTPLRDWW